jgi:hypothetical protein
MDRPTTHKELRWFNMWCRQSNLLTALTALTSKNVKIEWTDEHQHAFENV